MKLTRLTKPASLAERILRQCMKDTPPDHPDAAAIKARLKNPHPIVLGNPPAKIEQLTLITDH